MGLTDHTGGTRMDPGSGGTPRIGSAQYALLPLRLFLGLTFAYAGIDKLTDPRFPGSLGGSLESVGDAAAVPWLLDLALANAEGVGYAIALGELAVGVGVLAGLATRMVAAGGAVLSLSFWLTVGWGVERYHHSQDLPYLMAWIPLLIAGAPIYSLDAIRARRRHRAGLRLYG